MKYSLLIVIFLVLTQTNLKAQPGTLDVSFNSNGSVITDVGNYGGYIAIQLDKKILIAGYTYSTPLNPSNNFSLARFKENGEFDSSFGINGKVVTDLNGREDIATCIALQSDNKILVGGYTTNGFDYDFAIVRYKTNGVVDSSFGANGRLISNLSSNNDYLKGIVLQADGKIIAAGYQNVAGADALEIAKYTSTGKLDSSFGVNGLVTNNFIISPSRTHPIALQPDGKIIVTGYRPILFDNFAVARFTKNGIIDSTFGTNGVTITDFGANSYGRSVIIQKDNNIVIAGYVVNGQNAKFALARYKPSGKIDNSFGNDGLQITSIGLYAQATDLTVQTDNKLVVAGFGTNVSLYGFALARYSSSGRLDSSFGINGSTITNFGSNTSTSAYSVKLQTDGKIDVGGNISGNSNNLIIARYNNDVALPISIVSFNAIKNKISITLLWQTVNEQNGDYFSVERSSDIKKKQWIELNKIACKGVGNFLQSYSYDDLSPEKGTNYYRLKQVDKDGTISYSQIVMIDFGNKELISFYPNPVKNILNIQNLLASSNNELTIVTMNGQILETTNTNSASYQWNISGLASGQYILKVKTNNSVTTYKFIKE